MWLKGTFTETHGGYRRLFLSIIESMLNQWIINLSYVGWVLNFYYISFPMHGFNEKYYIYMKNKWESSNKVIKPLQLAIVGFWVLY